MSQTVVSECPKCGRRYVPNAALCISCSLIRNVPAELRETAIVLSHSLVFRLGRHALIEAPATIALVRETGDGATFTAPLVDAEAGSVEIGEVVSLGARSWALADGGEFTGAVISSLVRT